MRHQTWLCTPQGLPLPSVLPFFCGMHTSSLKRQHSSHGPIRKIDTDQGCKRPEASCRCRFWPLCLTAFSNKVKSKQNAKILWFCIKPGCLMVQDFPQTLAMRVLQSPRKPSALAVHRCASLIDPVWRDSHWSCSWLNRTSIIQPEWTESGQQALCKLTIMGATDLLAPMPHACISYKLDGQTYKSERVRAGRDCGGCKVIWVKCHGALPLDR